MNEEEPDAKFVHQCLQGDVDAFGTLVERYQRPIFSAILQMVGNYQDAKELSQQVFMKAFQSLSSYDPNRKFFSWIYRVAMNESINHLKARRSWEPISEQMMSPEAGPHQRFEAGQRGIDLQRAIRELDPKYRAVIVSRHFLQLSYSEAADALGLPIKTLKSRLFDARQLLRKALHARGYAE
jgi:RNA polymerase sigma-70 factor (ECF subfamily)